MNPAIKRMINKQFVEACVAYDRDVNIVLKMFKNCKKKKQVGMVFAESKLPEVAKLGKMILDA